MLGAASGADHTAAESNLQTALTAANAYYTQNAQSYLGLTTNAGVSTVEQQDTELIFTSTSDSLQASTIAYAADAAGNYVLLSALSKGDERCYAVLELPSSSVPTSLVAHRASITGAGTYYGYFDASSAGCSASAAGSNIPDVGSGAWQKGGFP